MSTQPDKLDHILLGAGGHGKVVLAAAVASGLRVRGVCDPRLLRSGKHEWCGYPVLGNEHEVLGRTAPATVLLLNGLGYLPGNNLRTQIQMGWEDRGFTFASVIHPGAWIAPDVLAAGGIGAGAQIMAGAIIQPGTTVGAGSIVNTAACVDHDCQIGDQVHIAPGAVLCGEVTLGDRVFVGAGATVINGLKLGAGAIVAAGATLITDVEAGVLAYGVASRSGRKSV